MCPSMLGEGDLQAWEYPTPPGLPSSSSRKDSLEPLSGVAGLPNLTGLQESPSPCHCSVARAAEPQVIPKPPGCTV